jgi:N-carbamoylputrescine amidase
MADAPQLLTAYPPPVSPARTRPSSRPPLRLGAVQERWHPDPDAHQEALSAGIRIAVGEGARIVCLQELTLSPYFAITPDGPAAAGVEPEDLETGPTATFARAVATETGAYIHASLYERAEGQPDDSGAAQSSSRMARARPEQARQDAERAASASGRRAGGKPEGLGYNTAILLAPDGELVSRTRKLHIPVTAGYYEDHYFRPGPSDGDPFPVTVLPVADGEARLGLPTCWDQWFPELARAYSLAGAEVLIYPTAIGSEPDHPDFDTEPLWQQVIVANGVANGTFMVAINRIGTEGAITFYGSSFICDPYGRVLVQAPRDQPAVLVADLDLDQRQDWLELFPLLRTRRPDAYGSLTER